ncbi:MAG: hypothetical protein M3Y13_00815 [Armatimonadota bacterium]|nr:hypothetical protein [Armatimonadota bacterium]
MPLRRKVATSDYLKGLTRRCPECGRTMTSNGEMYLDDGRTRWYVGFWCPYDREDFPIWAPELEPVIQQAAEGLDIGSLPYLGE